MSNNPLKVHITGVYGLIGNLVYGHLNRQPERYDVHGSSRRSAGSTRADADSLIRLPDTHFVQADLGDADAMRQAIAGMDAVLHIGAVPDPAAPFEDVLHSNVVGTYNVLEACRAAGVKRLVYASSVMATMGYFYYQEPYNAIREKRFDDVRTTFPHHACGSPRPPNPIRPARSGGKASAGPTTMPTTSPPCACASGPSTRRTAACLAGPIPSGAASGTWPTSSNSRCRRPRRPVSTSATGFRTIGIAGLIWNLRGRRWVLSPGTARRPARPAWPTMPIGSPFLGADPGHTQPNRRRAIML